MTQDHPRQDQHIGRDANQDHPQDYLDRITVAEAAERLGVTQDAIRKRIARGTILHDRDEDGRIVVYLDTFERSSKTVQDDARDDPSKAVQDEGQDKYTRSLEDQIQFLRRELERKDTIILSLVQRVPELEPPRDEPYGPQTAPEEPEGTETPSDREQAETGVQRRSWWRRFFGFE